MSNELTRISSDLEQALASAPNGTLKVEGASGTYWLLTEDAIQVRAEVHRGLEQLDRGEMAPWDSVAIKREGRQQLGQ